MSAPAAKALSLPVMTMQPMPASASKASSACDSSSISWALRALSAFGRLSRDQADAALGLGDDGLVGHGVLLPVAWRQLNPVPRRRPPFRDLAAAGEPVVLLASEVVAYRLARPTTPDCRPPTAEHARPRSGAPPEEREGGAGRPGSRPLASDLIAKGTKNALLGRLRRPPDAWIGPFHHAGAGYRRLDFAAPGLLPRPCAEGAPASTSNPVRRLSRTRWRLDGLSTMPADAPGHGTPAPSPATTAAAVPPDLPRRPQHATHARRCHLPSTYMMSSD